MTITDRELIEIQKEHLKNLYRVFNKFLGYRYKEHGYNSGMEYCLKVNKLQTEDFQLNKATYNFTFSPINQGRYKSVTIEDIDLNQVLHYIHLIVIEHNKAVWRIYYDNIKD